MLYLDEGALIQGTLLVLPTYSALTYSALTYFALEYRYSLPQGPETV